MQYRKIDENGFYLEDVDLIFEPKILVEGNIAVDTQYVSVECPSGFYLPKWAGTEWVEGKTQAEITAIVNTPAEITDSKRIKALEDVTNILITMSMI